MGRKTWEISEAERRKRAEGVAGWAGCDGKNRKTELEREVESSVVMSDTRVREDVPAMFNRCLSPWQQEAIPSHLPAAPNPHHPPAIDFPLVLLPPSLRPASSKQPPC